MTTLTDRTNTALLIVDVQRGNTGGAHNRDAVIANINALLDRARQSDAPIVWVQHSDESLVEGSNEWQYAEELQRRTSEPLVYKHFGDAFEETELEDLLHHRRNVRRRGQRHDLDAIAMRSRDIERARADRAGRSEDRDALHNDLPQRRRDAEKYNVRRPQIDAAAGLRPAVSGS